MNIIKSLLKEREAGRTLIAANGDVISPEKLDRNLIKLYSKKLTDGELSDTTYSAFKDSFISANYYLVDEVLDIFISSTIQEDDEAELEQSKELVPEELEEIGKDEPSDSQDDKFVTY